MKLTVQEKDVLVSIFIIFMHAAERCVTILEQSYEEEYKDSQDYQRLKKQYGPAVADEMLRTTTQRLLRQDEKLQVGKLLQSAKDFQSKMEKLSAISSRFAGEEENSFTFMQVFDYIQHDINFLLRVYSYIINCKDKDDEIKIETTLKMIAKDNKVPERLIDLFRPLL